MVFHDDDFVILVMSLLLLGTVYYLPFSQDSKPLGLPDIDQPLPPTWKALQVRNFLILFLVFNFAPKGPFFNVYACKQPWLDYQMYFCPDARPDDGKLWLIIQGAL